MLQELCKRYLGKESCLWARFSLKPIVDHLDLKNICILISYSSSSPLFAAWSTPLEETGDPVPKQVFRAECMPSAWPCCWSHLPICKSTFFIASFFALFQWLFSSIVWYRCMVFLFTAKLFKSCFVCINHMAHCIFQLIARSAQSIWQVILTSINSNKYITKCRNNDL